MSNYIISFDLADADSGIRASFMNELAILGWTMWAKRSSDREICRLPNTTMLIKDKTDAQVISTVRMAATRAKLLEHGVDLSKCVISEYRRVYFDSDEILTSKNTRADTILKQMIEETLLD